MSASATAAASASASTTAWTEGGRAVAPHELVPPDRSARVVTYEMDVRLDPASHEIAGTQRITWRNDSDESVASLWWHLYLNSFLNDRSTIYQEGEGQGRAVGGERDEDRVGERSYWGSCTLRKIELADGTDLLPRFSFRAPDDGNEDDRTVARVELPEPVPPGGTVTIETSFVSKLPWARRRTGFAGDYHFAAQWFPKLAVYEGVEKNPTTEGWNAHQYHAHTEFFADYGTYRVNITVPSRYGGENGGKVGATGVRVSENENDDGSWTYRFVQDDVHDFTWTADPGFLVIDRTYRHDERRNEAVRAEERFQRDEVGVPPGLLDLPDVEVRLLLQPEHRDQADRHLEAAFHAITWYGLWFGPYPYRTLTVVDPSNDGNRTGGMEYPTLITAGTRWRPAPVPGGPEGVTVHEFGHQYFYGLVGSNEFEEAWLDEGFNSYADDKAMQAACGPSPRFSSWSWLWRPTQPVLSLPGGEGWKVEGVLHLRPFGLRGGTWADLLFQHASASWARDVTVADPWGSRSTYVEHGRIDPMDTASWETLPGRSYRAIAYSKPATVLTQFERLLGRARFLRAMRLYSARYRFGHPNGTDFFRTLEEVTGLPVEVARQSLRPEALDYGIAEVKVTKVQPPVGLIPRGDTFGFSPPPEEEEDDGEDSPSDRFRSRIFVRRIGTLTAPVEIDVWLADAEEPERFTWDGEDPWHAVEIVRDKKVVRVAVDPARNLVMDVDLLNQDWADEADRRPACSWAARVLYLVQSMMLGARGLS